MNVMEVIDLCDDGNTEEPMHSNSPPIEQNITKAEDTAKPINHPKVPPIRVVNLASLQNAPRIISIAPQHKLQPNRLQFVQQANASNESIQFVQNPHTKVLQKIRIIRHPNQMPSTSAAAASGPIAVVRQTVQAASAQSSRPHYGPSTSTYTPQPARTSKDRPNDDLMRRVAFLRICAEHMLKSLDMHTITFGEKETIKTLTAQYNEAKSK